MASLIEILGRSCPPLSVVDVGAMWLGHEELSYRALLKSDTTRVIGFEPVESECHKLNRMGLKNHTFFPYFIGDGSERTFYLTADSMTASLYPPNMRLLNQFQQLGEITAVVSTQRVQTRRLDDLPEIAGIDFLKIDVQGAELDVLRGAQRHLKDTAVIQVEAELVPMYEGQPLFADVDTFLRSQGFLLHTMGALGRTFKPIVRPDGRNREVRQLLWSDNVYVKDFTKLESLTAAMLLKLAVIVNDIYSSPDLAGLALYAHDQKTKAGLWEVFMRRLLGRVPAEKPVL